VSSFEEFVVYSVFFSDDRDCGDGDGVMIVVVMVMIVVVMVMMCGDVDDVWW
jgi:hypothetical protein